MSETVYGPVTDWATDFDHGSPAYAADMHKIWDDLKNSGCPIAHTDRFRLQVDYGKTQTSKSRHPKNAPCGHR